MKLLIIPLLCLFSLAVRAGSKDFQILPVPQSIKYGEGRVLLPGTPTINYPPQLAGEAQLLAGFLQSDFQTRCRLKEKKKKGDILLELDPRTLPGKKEGYILSLGTKDIRIQANDPAGILHGIQTLRQILETENGRLSARQACITDWATFSWRAYMLDEGRYFKGKDVVKRILDRMSELKMNTFHWHLTDDQGWRIEIKKYPRLTEIGAFRDSTEIGHFESNTFDGKPHGGFYTQNDIREIVNYATERHINIIPEIEMPGHATAAIAAYPWLGTSGKEVKVACKFGVQYDVFNVASPRVMQFFEDVLDEVIALFPSPVIHIGGDEVRYNQWKASPEIQAYMKKNHLESPSALQVYFTNHISNLLASKGRRMMGWNEVTGAQVNHYQQGETGKQDQTLDSGTVVQFWHGDPALVKETVVKGYDVVNCHNIYTYLDYSYEDIPLEQAYFFNPVPKGLTPEQASHIIGLGCQMWCEFVPDERTLENKTYPRIAAYADTGWHGTENKDYPRFLTALNRFMRHWENIGIAFDRTQTTLVNPDTDLRQLHRFQDAKLGLFVHWMACHSPATGDSWNIGKATSKSVADSITLQWNPYKFDARAIVDVAVRAGCKYMVVISKHHDGFCIWPSKYSEFDTDRISFKRDILQELGDECRRRGLLFGIYYSIADIDYCGWKAMPGVGEEIPTPRLGREDFLHFVHNQTKELITRYHPDLLWFDGFWLDPLWTPEEGKELYRFIHSLDKHILSTRLSLTKNEKGEETFLNNGTSGDYFSMEAKTTDAPTFPWEACTSITYPVYAYEPNAPMLSADELLAMFNRTLCGGGNLLVNIGPKPDGTMPEEQADRLYELTEWINRNHEAVYGTQGGPFKQTDTLGCTYRKNKLYLHIRDKQTRSVSLDLPEGCKVRSAQVLSTGQTVQFTQQGRHLTVDFSRESAGPLPVIALTLKAPLSVNGWI